MKKIFFLFVFSSLSLFSFISVKKEDQKILKTIVIDPGHGGRDLGARGSYSSEKDICLAIALKLGKIINKEFPEIKVLYTRTNDTYPELHARADFANEKNGDLFISIHVNAAPAIKNSNLNSKKKVKVTTGKGKKKKTVTKKVAQYNYYTTPNPAKGTETYIWGAHKNEDKETAVRENNSMMQEENYKENYGDIDPDSPEFIALSLLKTKQYFKRSAALSGFVEQEFADKGRTSRGQQQRQIGIWVLQATAMPSILVETGYITNKAEEDYLNSVEGQQETANSVADAVRNYINWLENQSHQTNDSNHQ